MIFLAAVRPIKQDANVNGNVIACQGSGKGSEEALLTKGLLIPMIQMKTCYQPWIGLHTMSREDHKYRLQPSSLSREAVRWTCVVLLAFSFGCDKNESTVSVEALPVEGNNQAEQPDSGKIGRITESKKRSSYEVLRSRAAWDDFPLDVVFFDNPASLAAQVTSSPVPASNDSDLLDPEGKEGKVSEETVRKSADPIHLPLDVLEEEVRILQDRLSGAMAQLESYNKNYRTIRIDAATLAILAAVAAESEYDLKWKIKAKSVRDMAMLVRQSARSLGPGNYTAANKHFKKLVRLLSDKPGQLEQESLEAAEDTIWQETVDLSLLMRRLDRSFEITIKEAAIDGGSSRKNRSILQHEATLLRAFGQAISISSEWSQEDSYQQFCADLIVQAEALVNAVKARSAELVSETISKLDRSCKNCHDEYRFEDSF